MRQSVCVVVDVDGDTGRWRLVPHGAAGDPATTSGCAKGSKTSGAGFGGSSNGALWNPANYQIVRPTASSKHGVYDTVKPPRIPGRGGGGGWK